MGTAAPTDVVPVVVRVSSAAGAPTITIDEGDVAGEPGLPAGFLTTQAFEPGTGFVAFDVHADASPFAFRVCGEVHQPAVLRTSPRSGPTSPTTSSSTCAPTRSSWAGTSMSFEFGSCVSQGVGAAPGT